MSSTGGGIGHEPVQPSEPIATIQSQLLVILAHCDVPEVEAAVAAIKAALAEMSPSGGSQEGVLTQEQGQT